MAKKELTVEQRKLDADLWVIALISVAVLAVYMMLQNQFVAVITDSGINTLLRVLLGAAVQFGLAGLGVVVVSIFRKESLLAYATMIYNIIMYYSEI